MAKSTYIIIIAATILVGIGVLSYFYFMDGKGHNNYILIASNQPALEVGGKVYVDQMKTGEIVGINKNAGPDNLTTWYLQLPENINITKNSKIEVLPNADSSELVLNIELLPSYDYYNPGDTLVVAYTGVIEVKREKEKEKVVEPSPDSIPQKQEIEKAIVETDEKVLAPVVQLRVQVMVSSQEFAIDSKRFFGLKSIHFIKEGDLIKYFYGNPNSFDEATQLQKKAQQAGLKDAFVVAYQNGKRISIKEARSLIN